MRLEESGEFGFLGELIADLAERRPDAQALPLSASVVIGPGDDCAVLAVPSDTSAGASLVLTKDLLVDGVHFVSARVSAGDIGRKSVAVNISDLAAMGATPLCVLAGVAVPPSTETGFLRRLMGAAAEEAGRFGAAIVGGDLTRSSVMTVSITAVGTMGGAAPVSRAGARPGDIVLVTGSLGASAGGLRLLLDETPPGGGPMRLIDAHLHPVPRVRAGRHAALNGATAMIDVSDGFLQDLGHICEASEVGARIDVAELPLSPDCTAIFGAEESLKMALTGGEDYELVITCPRESVEALKAAIAQGGADGSGTPVTEVGEIVAAPQGDPALSPITLSSSGVHLPESVSGWDSFR